jgi:purine-binding chemotaxis protein CheW
MSGATSVPREHDALERHAGKYLAFEVAGREYGVEVVHVRGIVGLAQIARQRRTRELIRGFVHVRGGRAIPVVDPRRALGLPAAEATDRTVVVLMQLTVAGRRVLMGILVDEVLEVLSICGAEIRPPPASGSALPARSLLGVAEVDERVVSLVDLGEALAIEDLRALARRVA